MRISACSSDGCSSDLSMSNEQPTLAALEKRDDFVRRHIGPGAPQTAAMLEALGLESLDELVEKAVPASIRSATPMALPPVRNERDTLTYLRRMADRNPDRKSTRLHSSH